MNWVGRLFRGVVARREAPPASHASDVQSFLSAGNALLAEGKLDAAIEQYRLATHTQPSSAEAHLNLGFALIERGQSVQAAPSLERAVDLAPSSHDARYVYGKLLLDDRQVLAAIRQLERAVELDPTFVVAYRDLAKALHDAGDHERALTVLAAGIDVDARSADLHFYMGNVLLQLTQLTRAVECYRRALALAPNYGAVYANLAQALFNLSEYRAGQLAARTAVELNPESSLARSNLLMALSIDPSCSSTAYVDEARRYGELVTQKPSDPRAGRPFEAFEPERRLRVAFLSGDLHNHPVGYFLEGLLASWDGAGMEPLAYSNHDYQDELTSRLKSHVRKWHAIWGLSDVDALEQMRSDRIDVLVDLSGHTPYNRLPLLAQRAAPVQLTWLGYWASTGVPAIDYLLTDAVSTPAADIDQFTETARCLPDTRLCFSIPTGDNLPSVSELPALSRGHITFGSFQRLSKLTDEVLILWGRVLTALPASMLRIQSKQIADSDARTSLVQRLSNAGIAPARVQLFKDTGRQDYLAAHSEVDVLLDTFPHGGATTTCEALWMGVPTLTLSGPTLLSRQGASLLTCVGLSEWIARDESDYIARAVDHASGIAQLAELRATLRDRVTRSALFDAPTFARSFQREIRKMWREKCHDVQVDNAPFRSRPSDQGAHDGNEPEPT
ncbi:MAG: tetratricopeptide repeat protein [Pseudomonadota bacterium]